MTHDYSDFPCGPTTWHVIFESEVLIILVWLCSVNSVVMELICSNRPMEIYSIFNLQYLLYLRNQASHGTTLKVRLNNREFHVAPEHMKFCR